MNKMRIHFSRKAWKITGLTILAVVVFVVLGLVLAGGTFIKGAINTFGPSVLGVPVKLEDASFMPFRACHDRTTALRVLCDKTS